MGQTGQPSGGALDDVRPDTTPGHRRWSRPRAGTIGMLALVSCALLVTLWAARADRKGYLDPGAVDSSGSRAVANVLADNGVRVLDVRRTEDVLAQAPGATLLVTNAGLLSEQVVADVLDAGPERVVLLEETPGVPAFDRLAAGVELAADPSLEALRQPGCDYQPAQRAGSAELPGLQYDASAWAGAGHTCYSGQQAAALVVLPARDGRPEVVLLGSSLPLKNSGFAEQGNASLVLSLLGSRTNLVWWRPEFDDPAISGTTDERPLSTLVPAWVLPVTLQLLVSSLFLAWWRARRMGPLVTERLPVVVRAGETTSGRARLLRAHHARGTAAEHLRSSAREHVRSTLRLPIAGQPAELVEAAARRAGRSAHDVGELLFGQAPETDAQLVTLSHELDNLVQEVRRT